MDLDSSQLEALEVCTITAIQVKVLVEGNGETSWDFETERHTEDCVVLDCRLQREKVYYLGSKQHLLHYVRRLLWTLNELEIYRSGIVLQEFTADHIF